MLTSKRNLKHLIEFRRDNDIYKDMCKTDRKKMKVFQKK